MLSGAPTRAIDRLKCDRGLLAICVAAAAIRFATLDLQSFELDEASTVHLLRMSFTGMLRAVRDTESTPPLYFVLAWLWTHATGISEVGLRSLSALAGVALVPVAYLVGREVSGRAAGLVAAALTAFSPIAVWHAQQARSYALVMLLCGISTLCFLRALRRAASGPLIGWTVSSGLAIATHYFAYFIVAVSGVWLLFSHRRSSRVLVAAAAVGAVGAALLPVAIHQQHNYGGLLPYLGSLGTRIVQVPKQLLVGFHVPGQLVLTILAAALFVAALVGLLRALWSGPASRNRGGLMALVTMVGATIALPIAIALAGTDEVDTRNVLVAWVPLAALAGTGFVGSSAVRVGRASAVALCALGAAAVAIVDLDRGSQRDDWRGASRALGVAAVPRIIVVTPNASVALAVYLDRLSEVGGAVEEVDYVGLPTHVAGDRSPPSAASAPPFPPGGRLFVRERTPRFTVIRVRLSHPVRWPPGTAAPGLGGPGAVLEQRPDGAAR